MATLHSNPIKSSVVVTGGLGYLGSHTVVQLMNKGYSVIVIDNLINSDQNVLDRIQKITGTVPIFCKGDIRNSHFLDQVFNQYTISSVIHFAGLKDVSESLKNPTDYFSNNVSGSITLFGSMRKNNVNTIIFSSSANVYGDPISTPIAEDHPINPTNPYGKSKWMIEEILKDIKTAEHNWKIAILRYFNPAYTKNFAIPVYGNDYSTNDGTPIRDFIHVEDLASGHISCLEYLLNSKGIEESLTLNLGTGRPTTILQLLRAFYEATGIVVPYEFKSRRESDISVSFTNPDKAYQALSWRANKNIHEMCEDAWRWKLYESQSTKKFIS
jgi:UDP-glucose 4-epimerase